MSNFVIELGQRHWRIVASNGEVVAHSEQYATAWNAKRAAKRLHKMTGLPLLDAPS